MEQYVRKLNDHGFRPGGEYVLYWIRTARRVEYNPSLVLAAGLANSLGLPLLTLECLTSDYHCASDRFHTFVLEGVSDLAASFRKLGVGYVLYFPTTRNSENHTLERWASRAAAVVTDDWPSALSHEDPGTLDVRCYAVDSSCIVPHTAIPDRAYAAYSFRPKIERLLDRFLKPLPPVQIERTFPDLADFWIEDIPRTVAACEIDHSVPPSLDFRGGRKAALRRLSEFLEHRLSRYAGGKNEPSAHVTSELSPYLHYGYISGLEIALAVRRHAAEHRLIADEFLEELIVRRELAFNFTYCVDRVDTLSSLPDWARKTLAAHRKDQRNPVYSPLQFEAAATGDELWNATQKELLVRGRIHGYCRMYWGKKILEWSANPEEALDTMIHLHDRYALDGHDPNTYTNILWCFGLHDRPWPERPIFGTVRSMTRNGMDRKTDTAAYIREIQELAP